MNSKAKVIIKYNAHYLTEHTSFYRVLIDKPIVEKYARKLAQDFLHSLGIYGMLMKLDYLGVKSQRAEGWIFGLWIPLSQVMFDDGSIAKLDKVAIRDSGE